MKLKLVYIAIAMIFIGCKNGDHQHQDHDEIHKDHDTTVLGHHKSVAQIKQELTAGGFQIFDYVDTETGDTVIMQQYFIAFLKRGPNRSQDSLEAIHLQEAHLNHLGEMYKKGYADISGPFGDDGEIRGITVYNVPTFKMADSLANMDPAVQAGRLEIEVHPWWAAKGFPLR